MAEKTERTLEIGEITLGTAAAPDAQPVGRETPFRILVLGDFSGGGEDRPACAGAELAARQPLEVHPGNFDEVLRRFEIKLTSVLVGPDGTPTAVSIGELEDFEPDRLLERVGLFSSLLETRRRLLDSSTFKEAAAEVREWLGRRDERPSTEAEPKSVRAAKRLPPQQPTAPQNVDLGQLLNEAVEETQPSRGGDVSPAFVDMQSLAAELAAPYQLERPDPAQAELVACVEEMLAAALRSLLHHPRFQTLEAAWRGVHFLVKRLETGPSLQVHLLDVSKADLVADLTSAKSFAASGLYRLLVEQSVGTPGSEPWALLVGNYKFDGTLQDALLAGGLATIAMAAGAPFVAAASPHLFGCSSLAETPDPDDWQWPTDERARRAWTNVRNLNVAPYLGLAAPRFLLRRPYGPESSPIDAFAFEELQHGKPDKHEAYLWGNPAFAVACLLGQFFSHSGWAMRPGTIGEIDGLPLYVHEQNGQTRIQPCTETLLTYRAIEAIRNAGIMPLAAFKDQDRIQLVRFCSFAADGSVLSGRWGRP